MNRQSNAKTCVPPVQETYISSAKQSGSGKKRGIREGRQDKYETGMAIELASQRASLSAATTCPVYRCGCLFWSFPLCALALTPTLTGLISSREDVGERTEKGEDKNRGGQTDDSPSAKYC